MTKNKPSRRQFLVITTILLGIAALGGIAWAVDQLVGSAPSEIVAAPTTSSTVAPAMTTLPPPTTSTTTTSSTSTTTLPTTTTTTLAPIREVKVICRDAWGALPPSAEFTLHEINQIMIHHNGRLMGNNQESPGVTRGHQRYHQGAELGWPDIAYHFLIDLNGHVYQGRRWDAAGDTRTNYDPTGFLLIAAKGNFEKQEPTDAQLDSLYNVLAWGAEKFGINPEDIVGHRDYAATACPGKTLYALLTNGQIASEVQARLDSATTHLVDFCGPEATDLVAAIEAGTA